MPQGRKAIYDLVAKRADWPPVVVPFGLDPWGWHGDQPSYRAVCDFALENCTLLPKVYPLNAQLFIGEGDIHLVTRTQTEPDGTVVKRHELIGAPRSFSMEEVRTPGDSSWKNRKRWVAGEEDFACLLGLDGIAPARPDIDAVREKELQVGDHGLPYVEVADPFGVVTEMMPTDEFYVRLRTDTDRLVRMLDMVAGRILAGIEILCRDTGAPFILRLIGAEMAVPPFLGRDDFLRFEGAFYARVSEIARHHQILTAFHCHGPVRAIMGDIWQLGYDFIEPFEPIPRGDITIGEALHRTNSRGVVFGGIDDVIFNTGAETDVRKAVKDCLDGARETGLPYILSQSATPFHDPLTESASRNLILFMELGTRG